MKKGKVNSSYKSKKKKLMNKNKKVITYVLLLFALICLISVSYISYNTYSIWVKTYSQKGTNIVTTGCFELSVTDVDENNNSTAIDLKNAYPLSDTNGLLTKPYTLKISNICTVPSEYSIILNSFNTTTLDEGVIKYQLKEKSLNSTETMLLQDADTYDLDETIKNDIETANSLTINKSYILADGTLNEDENITYELRVWLDYEATNEAMNKIFEAGVTVLSTSPQ